MVKHIKTELLILPCQSSLLHLFTNHAIFVISLALLAACSAFGGSLFPSVWALNQCLNPVGVFPATQITS